MNALLLLGLAEYSARRHVEALQLEAKTHLRVAEAYERVATAPGVTDQDAIQAMSSAIANRRVADEAILGAQAAEDNHGALVDILARQDEASARNVLWRCFR